MVDLFGTRSLWLKVPPAERIVALAIIRLNDPSGSTEQEIIAECARMKEEGLHSFSLGSSGKPGDNIRNRFQRNWSKSKIYQDEWGERYASVFEQVAGTKPKRWRVIKGFAP
jgi:hypothetical protein